MHSKIYYILYCIFIKASESKYDPIGTIFNYALFEYSHFWATLNYVH